MKNDTAIFWIVGIIVAGLLLYNYGYFGEMFTMVRSGTELDASNFDYRTWNVAFTSHQPASAVGVNGTISDLTITHVNGDSGFKEKFDFLCSKINDIAGAGTCTGMGSTEPTSTFASRVSGLATQYLGNSFMVFEGTYNTWSCESRTFKTYGLCNQFICYIYDPAPEVEPAMGDCYMGELFPTSIKIYFKAGGYTEESGKAEFGFNVIPEIEVFRLENNQCNPYTILETEKLVSDYLTLTECQSHIIISCNPSWGCTSWSNCSNSLQSRTCTDSNNCGNVSSKPVESQSCSIQCIPNWQIGNWSTCSNSLQTRIVTDSNSCGITTGKPATSQSCDSTICTTSQNKCVSTDYYECSSNAWINKGKIEGKCGYVVSVSWYNQKYFGIKLLYLLIIGGIIGLIFLIPRKK